jgi:autophagy-related protein 2
MPELGPAPDMIYDDLPMNLEYLDTSFGATKEFRGMEENNINDILEFGHDVSGSTVGPQSMEGVISNFRGETIRMLDSRGIQPIEGYFESIQEETTDLKARCVHHNLDFIQFESSFLTHTSVTTILSSLFAFKTST